MSVTDSFLLTELNTSENGTLQALWESSMEHDSLLPLAIGGLEVSEVYFSSQFALEDWLIVESKSICVGAVKGEEAEGCALE